MNKYHIGTALMKLVNIHHYYVIMQCGIKKTKQIVYRICIYERPGYIFHLGIQKDIPIAMDNHVMNLINGEVWVEWL